MHGTKNAVLPQIPLTLTNAIIVTAAVSRQLFPNEVNPLTERNLALTTGLENLLAAPFGGYLMCHGAGGIAGHVRFGARTATAPVLIGLVFVALGIGFGESGYADAVNEVKDRCEASATNGQVLELRRLEELAYQEFRRFLRTHNTAHFMM